MADLRPGTGELLGFRNRTPAETKDYVTVILREGSTEVARKMVEIEWRTVYSTGFMSQQAGFFVFTSREEYDNFR